MNIHSVPNQLSLISLVRETHVAKVGGLTNQTANLSLPNISLDKVPKCNVFYLEYV